METSFEPASSQWTENLSELKDTSPHEKRAISSSLRLKFEAESQVLERNLGGWQGVREKLRISDRRIAQLLLVDPSTLSRWTGHRVSTPPYVWRALAWYFTLEEKYPALDKSFWLQSFDRKSDFELANQSNREIRKELLNLHQQISELKDLHQKLKKLALFFTLAICGSGLALGLIFLFRSIK